MARKKKRKDKGALEYISPKSRKKVKALIRELGLEMVSVTVSKNNPMTSRARICPSMS